MDISKWPMDKIMQLPRSVFGRKWIVSCSLVPSTSAKLWDISEIAFSENTVIWEFSLTTSITSPGTVRYRLALSNTLPTLAVQFDALQPLFPGLGLSGSEPRQITVPRYQGFTLRELRLPIHTAGKRLVLETGLAQAGLQPLQVALVVSSIPREVPDLYMGPPTKQFDEMIRLLRIGVNVDKNKW